MATLAKSYYITHIDSLIIEASSFRRPFDDLYDELNGFLNSENLASNFAVGATQVSVTDTSTFYSATQLEDLLFQSVPKGFHDIHFFAYGRGSAFGSIPTLSVFPGRAEVHGRICRVQSKLNLTISSISFLSNSFTLFVPSGSYSETFHVGVFINQANVITASDIFLYSVTATTLFGTNKMGLYNTSQTSSKRGLYTFAIPSINTSSSYVGVADNEFLTPPITTHAYQLEESEARNLLYFGYATATGLGTTTSGGFHTAIYRFFNMSTWRYDYETVGRLVTASTTAYNIFNMNTTYDSPGQTKFVERSFYAGGEYINFYGQFFSYIGGSDKVEANDTRFFHSLFYLNNQPSNTVGTLRFRISDNLKKGMMTNG